MQIAQCTGALLRRSLDMLHVLLPGYSYKFGSQEKLGWISGPERVTAQYERSSEIRKTNMLRELITQTNVPHFRYYSNLGCMMTAIDVRPSPDERIESGDVRLLRFAYDSFDFVTIPMILGPGGTCSSYLELAFSLAELDRVLKLGGPAYIADAGFQPPVGYMAERFGFSVYTSKASASLPVGTMLQKVHQNSNDTCWRVLQNDSVKKHTFDDVGDQVFTNCNLLFDSGHVAASSN